MKDRILKLLKGSDNFVSGQDISEMFGVSRTAIWKYMNALKEEGYVIESSSKKGYKLLNSPDVLTESEVLPLLKTEVIGREIVHFDSIDSTNNMARINAASGCSEGLTVIAEEQTAGKGRLGRKWITPKSTSIAMSIVLRPGIKPSDAAGITLVMGTAVCRAIRNTTGLDVGIKWPNDIIINGKKVCGILTEMSAEIDIVNYIIVGTGINVNVTQFPEEIRDIATSLCLECKKSISRKEVLAAVLYEFEKLYSIFKTNGLQTIIQEFKSYSVTLGRHVKVISINEAFEGIAQDITPDGILLVKVEGGSVKMVIAGDVSVKGLNGYL